MMTKLAQIYGGVVVLSSGTQPPTATAGCGQGARLAASLDGQPGLRKETDGADATTDVPPENRYEIDRI